MSGVLARTVADSDSRFDYLFGSNLLTPRKPRSWWSSHGAGVGVTGTVVTIVYVTNACDFDIQLKTSVRVFYIDSE